MYETRTDGWLSYFLTGILALLMGWITSGCRTGNHADPAKAPDNPDKVSGYYQLAPQSYSVCGLTSTMTNFACQQQATNLMPPDPIARFTNPSAIMLSDVTSGDGRLFQLPAVNGSYQYTPIVIDQKSKAYSYSKTFDPQQLWYNDFNCTFQTKLDIAGTYSDFSAPQTSGDYKMRGQISQTAVYTYAMSANCGSELTAMKSCYSDETTCGGASDTENKARQSEVAADFQMYFDANVFSVNDLTDLQAFGYVVTY